MADPRVVVAGVTLRGRRLQAQGAAACRIVTAESQALAGAGAVAAVAATAGASPVLVSLVSRVGADEAGTWCLAELIGHGVDVSRVSRWGSTGERIVVESDTRDEDVVLVPGEVEGDGIPVALRDCRPGDVLLVDACVLARHPEVVEIAYDADVQVVADLCPVVGGSLDPEVTQRVDVAIIDPAGAGALADAAVLPPPSLAVFGGPLGSWWDDLRYEPAARGVTAGARLPLEEGVHRFAGALAAALACGEDRPEAFATALSVAGGRVEA